MQRSVPRNTPGEGGAIGLIEFLLLRQVAGNLHDVVAHRFGMVAYIGFGNVHRGVDDGAGAEREPCIKATVQSYGGEDRHDDRRNDRDQAEQRHQPEMERGARRTAALLDDQEYHLPQNQQRHDQEHDAVQHHQRHGGLAGGLDRRHAREDSECRQAADDARHHQRKAGRTRETAQPVKKPGWVAISHATSSSDTVAGNQH